VAFFAAALLSIMLRRPAHTGTVVLGRILRQN